MAPVVERLEDQRIPNNGNCTLSFSSADGGYSLSTKVRKLAHKWVVVATESHAREQRAMYPKQRSVGQFALTFDLNGYNQFNQLMQFFRSYVAVIGQQFDNRPTSRPTMQVVMAVRGFSRAGVPISGMSMGDHIGSMVFNPTIVFESAHDPQDPTILTGAQASTTDLAGAEKDAKSFFYPFSAASYDTNVKPDTVYDFTPNDGSISQGLNGALNNAIGNVKGAVEDILDAQGRANG